MSGQHAVLPQLDAHAAAVAFEVDVTRAGVKRRTNRVIDKAHDWPRRFHPICAARSGKPIRIALPQPALHQRARKRHQLRHAADAGHRLTNTIIVPGVGHAEPQLRIAAQSHRHSAELACDIECQRGEIRLHCVDIEHHVHARITLERRG